MGSTLVLHNKRRRVCVWFELWFKLVWPARLGRCCW